MKKIQLFFLLLICSVFATTISDVHYCWLDDCLEYFDTQMQFTTDMTLSAQPGVVGSGDPTNLVNRDTICSGGDLTVSPEVSATWATSSLDIISPYELGGAEMIPYSGSNLNRRITWLDAATYNDAKSYGLANLRGIREDKHDQLGTFYTQPVNYQIYAGDIDYNKEGGATVVCKGNLQVIDGTTVVSTQDLADADDFTFSIDSTGTHSISTQMSGVECFTVVEKRPLERGTAYFAFYHFIENPPSIPSTMARETISIQVEEGGGSCDFEETQVESLSSSEADILLIRVRMRNNGDPIRITDVDGSDYTVLPHWEGACDFFPASSSCPSDNGFRETIDSGETHDLYVILFREDRDPETVLTFYAETISGSCGGSSSCSDEVDLTGVIACEIDPSTREMGTNEVWNFDVSCENIAGDSITCTGNDWYWEGLSGGFIEATNSYAHAYTTSPDGSTGTLNYESGIAHCLSEIEATDSTFGYECEFDPDSAELDIGESQDFEFSCTLDGEPIEPDDVDYDVTDGLDASLSDSDNTGTTLTGEGESDGNLQGYGTWDETPDEDFLGVIGQAYVEITNETYGGDGNETGGGDGGSGGDGSSGSNGYCTIGSGSLNVYPGYNNWLPLMCGPGADEPCDQADWRFDSDSAVGTVNGDETGANVYIGGPVGASGRIVAIVDDEGHYCWKSFTVNEVDCWEFT